MELEDSQPKENQKAKVLIVEDLPFNAKINKSYVERCGGEVVGMVENGQEAVAKLEELVSKGEAIDLVLMDIEMPIMNGKEAARRIRKVEVEKNLPMCPIYFLSGNCLQKEIEECLNPQGDIRGSKFLRKPLKFEDFQMAWKENGQ